MGWDNIEIKTNEEIETERLLLRKLQINDIKDMFEYGQDPEVSKYVMWNRYESIDDAVKFANFIVESYNIKNIKFWAIILKENKKMIGTINYVSINEKHKWGEIGYVLNRIYWNRGIMTEALQAVLKFGFEVLKLNKIQAKCILQNKGSYKVMEKIGMIYEGISRQHLIKNNEFFDLKCYSILSSEYETYSK